MMRSRNGGQSQPPSNNLNDDINSNTNLINSKAETSPKGYKVYKERWLMLAYLSLLNLLSDWTGLSVAPIATITSRAYSSDDDYIYANDNNMDVYIQPEALVTVFLIASSIGTALEPWILGRLGLRRTIVFGAFSNMLGNLIKSGGLPPVFTVTALLHGVWGTMALYVGFFLVGFAQPLFQCTPALLSASWFPESERTMATSIALNANQLGVGLAFIVGALYVQNPNQIANYFSLLSLISVIAFVGTSLHLDDAPPTPPSGSSRIMKGTLEVSIRDVLQRATSSSLLNKNFDTLCAKEKDIVTPTRSTGNIPSNVLDDESTASLLRRHTRSRDNITPPHSPSSKQHLGSPYSTTSYYPADCEGAEPTLTLTPHHIEIEIRDDQVFLAAKACLSRKGFPQALCVFSCVGVVINVLSTYLDYLVRGDYYGSDYNNQSGGITTASIHVAVIGCLFQVIIMVSSIYIGRYTDKTRSYFMITLILLVLGVVALAECGVSLDKDREGDVRWTMLLVSALLGPLLPVATELAVEVAYPLSENTVLVVLQLACNIFSSMFIPVFQAFRDVGVTNGASDDDQIVGSQRPPYTISFYILIVITSVSAVFFATFNGNYSRYEAELAKKRGDVPNLV